jgi:putative transposase
MGVGAYPAAVARTAERGRKVSVDLREMLNAIRYTARSGGGWRKLPINFGPWQMVYWWFRRFVRRMLFRTIHDVSLMLDRERVGREARMSGGVVDSQTVNAPHAQARGYDANKKISAASATLRSIPTGVCCWSTDHNGQSPTVPGHRPSSTPSARWPWLKHLFADSVYDRTKLLDKAVFQDFGLEIVRRAGTDLGFKMKPRRWVVERIFGWITRWRRLVRDYETRLMCRGHDPRRHWEPALAPHRS